MQLNFYFVNPYILFRFVLVSCNAELVENQIKYPILSSNLSQDLIMSDPMPEVGEDATQTFSDWHDFGVLLLEHLSTREEV